MKIYVASSWRNEKQIKVVKQLRKEGFEVYDFKDSEGFHWSEIDPNWESWTSKEFIAGLQHELAEKGFKRDHEALDQCDVCVLVMPCGRSAHLELGYAVGKGKITIVLLDNSEPELMYKFVNVVTDTIKIVISWCKSLEEGFNKDNLEAGVTVEYKNKIYKTGNRHHTSVELYKNGKFVCTVAISQVKVIYNDYKNLKR